ncbi:MAG: helicase-related protein [Thermoleophilia bacterium]
MAHGVSGGAPARVARYTGQEDRKTRDEIRLDPPDVILTNYVMLFELLLTRPYERSHQEASNLRFLVLDELHTYRGRQGSDVAMLVRRVREASGVKHLQCVGTSATLAGPGTPAEQRAQIATVASRLFGTDLPPDNVVGETLRRSTAERDVTDPGFIGELTSRVSSPAGPPADLAAFRADPLASWLEDRVGIARDPATGDLRRADPLPGEGPGGLAEELAQATGHPAELCRSAIEATLMRGQAIQRDDAPFPVFAFRVHQFISRGDTAYATIESPDARYITVNGRSWAPGGRERRLFPLVFCRECGQEYYAVQLVKSGEDERLEPRDPTGRDADKTGIPGYLYASPENPWPTDPAEVLERVPDDWLEANGRLKSSFRGHLPQALSVAPRGEVGAEGVEASFMPSPFRMCLCCGVAYSGRAADFGKVGTLGSEGRSTATTIIGGSLIRGLREDPEGVPEHARKLLSFTDNRQDASLQAGHFNDFVEVGVLRAGLFQALSTAGPEGVEYDLLAARVAEAMNVPMEAYAANPSAKFGERESVEKVFREVVGYRTYLDQQRGWRITSPNLEQTGLLHISYKWLTSACEADEDWKGKHPALAGASPQAREAVARILLDTLRRELAIEVMYLDPFHQEQIAQRSGQFLAGRWALDPDEPMTSWSIAYPRPRRQGDSRFAFYLSARGGFGRLLRRTVTFPDHGERLSGEDAEIIMRDLLEVLADAGLVRPVDGPGDVPGYRVNAGAMVWRAGEGIDVPTDPVRTPRPPSGFRAPNSFFLDLYRREALEAPDLEGREHTAQVPAADREDREQAFRQGRLPVLFCSPTMELGVDISELNVVNMRNVPPTPANYAQRSGRAGRSGQPALVVTYCSTGSPHDQYFFRRPQRMVAGQVAPPRLDLGNEDLVRAHVHALWLAETGADLGSSLADVLDLAHPDLPVRDGLATDFASEHARVRALARASGLMASVRAELGDVDWFHDAWLDDAVNQAPRRFDEACDRWRSMYRAAQAQRDLQDKISADVSRPMDERRRAERLRGQAVTQLYLLESRDEDLAQSDFYSYRYFASEGFLPGYSFPRLPLAAFIPARRRTKRDGDYISRPRFLAISEFGPRSVIYHEGARYVVNQVTLPIETSESGDSSLPLREAKRCDSCGYLHEVTPNWSAEICDHCGALLGGQLRQLLRLTNVSTRRRQRITSDEEERMRLGYEIVTGLRFATRDGHEVKRLARATDGATPLVQMAYGPAATIWRINLGWRRRSNPNQLGFVLDTQSGYWARNEEQQDDQQDPMSAQQNRVVPFVEDRRNLLTLTPAARLDTTAMLSLMTALTNAVQVVYQLEPSELAAEPLPNVDHPGALLFYESAEGGAGVLRHLTEDAHALPEVARQALRLCHFDPERARTSAPRRTWPRPARPPVTTA